MSDKTPSLFDERTSAERKVAFRGSVIPKEKLTAFERWELASFDVQSEEQPQNNDHIIDTALAAEALLRQQEYEAIRESYRAEGYAEGMRQAQADSVQIQALLQNLQVALNQLDERLAQSLLDLSLSIARQMVRGALQVQPEIIVKVVSEAIGTLPHFNQNAHLILHPDDAELVRAQMGEQLAHANWKIFTDQQIQRGGCRVETAHSNVDATNEERWKHIVESIGQDQSWLSR